MKFQKAPKRHAQWSNMSSKTWEVTCLACGKYISGEYASVKRRQAAHERGHLRGNHQHTPRMRW